MLYFRKYFEGSCHISVPGRMYPVQEFYLEDILLEVNHTFKRSRPTNMDQQVKTIKIQDQSNQFLNQFERIADEEDLDGDIHVEITEMDEEKCRLMEQALSDAFQTGNFDHLLTLIFEQDFFIDYQVSVLI
jgi:HrpA-like RNA helicase